MTAILGPNGAGKSTFLRLLCGLVAPSQGEVKIHGHNPRTHREVLRYVGIVAQHDGTFPGMTAQRFVEVAARLNGVESPTEAAAAALVAVNLDPADRRAVQSYSKGMRQRVKIAQALVHGPAVIVADEPLNGLDPRQRRQLIETFQALAEEGRCVVVSSHVLDEVERFGSRVLVLAQGRLAAEGDFHRIRELMDDRPHRVRLGTDRPAELAAELLSLGVVRGAEVGDSAVEVTTNDLAALGLAVAPVTQRIDAALSGFEPLDDDLDSVFRYLVESTHRGAHQ